MVGVIFFYRFHPGDEFPAMDLYVYPAGDF